MISLIDASLARKSRCVAIEADMTTVCNDVKSDACRIKKRMEAEGKENLEKE